MIVREPNSAVVCMETETLGLKQYRESEPTGREPNQSNHVFDEEGEEGNWTYGKLSSPMTSSRLGVQIEDNQICSFVDVRLFP